MSNFYQLIQGYAPLYGTAGLKLHGRIGQIGVWKEYWYGRRVDKIASPYPPASAKQAHWRGYYRKCYQTWQSFDETTKAIYNTNANKEKLSGINLFMRMYLNYASQFKL